MRLIFNEAKWNLQIIFGAFPFGASFIHMCTLPDSSKYSDYMWETGVAHW